MNNKTLEEALEKIEARRPCTNADVLTGLGFTEAQWEEVFLLFAKHSLYAHEIPEPNDLDDNINASAKQIYKALYTAIMRGIELGGELWKDELPYYVSD